MIFELLDYAIANSLAVSKEEYIRKIESISEKRMEIIINGLCSSDPAINEKAKRIFFLIK